MKQRIKNFLITAFKFIANPRLLFCFAIAWIFTNGWAYVLLGVGTYHGIEWMMAVGGGYVAFLWLPFTPEKILTLFLSIGLLHVLFPHDTKTLGLLKELLDKQKQKKKKRKSSENPEDSDITKESEASDETKQ